MIPSREEIKMFCSIVIHKTIFTIEIFLSALNTKFYRLNISSSVRSVGLNTVKVGSAQNHYFLFEFF